MDRPVLCNHRKDNPKLPVAVPYEHCLCRRGASRPSHPHPLPHSSPSSSISSETLVNNWRVPVLRICMRLSRDSFHLNNAAKYRRDRVDAMCLSLHGCFPLCLWLGARIDPTGISDRPGRPVLLSDGPERKGRRSDGCLVHCAAHHTLTL